MSNFNSEYTKIINETKFWDSFKKALKPSGWDEFKKSTQYKLENPGETLGGAAGRAVKGLIKAPFNIAKNFGKEASSVMPAQEKPQKHDVEMPSRQIIQVHLPFSKSPVRLRYNMWNAYEDKEKDIIRDVYRYFRDESTNVTNDPSEQQTYKYMEKLLNSLVYYLNLEQSRIQYNLTNLPVINVDTITLETFVDRYFSKMFD